MRPGHPPGLPMLAVHPPRRRGLLREPVEDIDELCKAPGALGFPLLEAVGDAFFDVEFQDGEADAVQRSFGSRKLLQDFDAKPWLLDHAPDPAHLPFDAVQARDEGLLLCSVQHKRLIRRARPRRFARDTIWTVVVVSHLTRTFEDRTAVDNVSFEIPRGEVFGLLGPNGAGKTTTLRMIGGLILPTGGHVTIDGTRIDRANTDTLRRRIGFLTESPGLWEQLTVFTNLVTYAKLFGVTHPVNACERMLRRFDLWNRRHDRAATLSKGMKQKLALARALVHDPEIVLLDEPTANLDPQTARGVRDLVSHLRDRGRVVIISTHNLDEVERVATRIALISTRLIAVGEPSALRRSVFGRRLRVVLAPGTRPAALLAPVASHAGALDVAADAEGLTMRLDDPDAQVPAIITALVGAGAAIRSAHDEEPSLEEVYIRLLAKGAPS